jgi:hypothetical protein
MPTVHISPVTPPAASRTTTSPLIHEHKVFLLKQQFSSQGQVKGKSTKGTSTTIDDATVVRTRIDPSFSGKTGPSPINSVGFPSLDASSRNTAKASLSNVYPPFSFGKSDAVGKASVVSLVNPSAAAQTSGSAIPWSHEEESPRETVTFLYGGLTVSNPKIPEQVSPAALLGLDHARAGLGLSPNAAEALLNGIREGGAPGMALALSFATSIAAGGTATTAGPSGAATSGPWSPGDTGTSKPNTPSYPQGVEINSSDGGARATITIDGKTMPLNKESLQLAKEAETLPPKMWLNGKLVPMTKENEEKAQQELTEAASGRANTGTVKFGVKGGRDH